ncbi:hypothetical protein BGZ72_000703 [Mortierella alpina]|nr:hypothetical protein BGZ72_000703 [Mortierella alpina]
MLFTSQSFLGKAAALAVVASLLVAQAQADLGWTQLNADQAYAAGQQAQELTGQAVVQGVGGCAVSVVGLVAVAAAAIGCSSAPPPVNAACYTGPVLAWFGTQILALSIAAKYECSQIGQDFNGHLFADHCFAAEWLMKNKPPGGVPAGVSSFYRKQCSDTCTNPRRCNSRAKDKENKENANDVD